MKTEIIITHNFQKEAKKYLKKYISLKSELENLYFQLTDNPQLGKLIGKNTYKIRVSVKSKGKGKSGGLRVISHLELDFLFEEKSNRLFLLSIYDKSEVDSISDSDIIKILKGLKKE